MNNKNLAAAVNERHRDSIQGILYISAGLPGAGKSTFLNKNKREEEVIISRDKIRFSLLKEGEDYFSHEDEVFNIFIQSIIKNIKAGKNVYADATHLSPGSQMKVLVPILHETAPAQINYIYFDVPLVICLQRNELRKGTIAYCPPKAIKHMAEIANFIPCRYIDNAWVVDEETNIYKMKY